MSAGARSSGRRAAVLLLTSTALFVLAPPASAHVVLVRSDPPAGATLASGPHVVGLWFSEEVSQALSSARLVDGEGRTVAGARLRAPLDARSLTLEVPALAPGSYGVLWRVLDEADGHTASGALVFHVGKASRSAAIREAVGGPSDPPLDVALRWLAFCGLAGIVGALGVGVLVIGRAERKDPGSPLRATLSAARRRVTLSGAVCAAAASLVGLGILIAEARRLTPPGGSFGTTIATLLGTRWGALWIVRECSFLAAGALMLISVRSLPRASRPRPIAVAMAFVLAAVATQALGSHAASLDEGRAAAIVADGIHLLTACLWVGSLPALLLLLWPPFPAVSRSALVRACRTPFSWLAGTSVCFVAATGLYSAGRQVQTIDAVTSTGYGRTLLVKTVIVGAAGVLGLINALRLRGWRSGRRRDHIGQADTRSPSLSLIVAESGLGIVILLVAGVLIGSPPPGDAFVNASGSSTRTVYGSVNDLVVSVAVSPNRPGANGFTLVVASSTRPPPAPVEDVALELERGRGIGVVTLTEIEPGRYFGTSTLDGAGRWNLTAFILRAGQTLPVRFHLSVPRSSPPFLERSSVIRLAPLADGLALIVLAGGMVVAVTARRRTIGSSGRRRAADAHGLPEGDGGSPDPAPESDHRHALTGSRGRGP